MPETATLSEELGEHMRRVFLERQELEDAMSSLTKAAEGLRHQAVKAVKDQAVSAYANAHVFSRDPSRQDDGWRDLRGGYFVWKVDEPLIGVVARYEISTKGNLELIIIVPGKKDEYKIEAKYYTIEILDSLPAPG